MFKDTAWIDEALQPLIEAFKKKQTEIAALKARIQELEYRLDPLNSKLCWDGCVDQHREDAHTFDDIAESFKSHPEAQPELVWTFVETGEAWVIEKDDSGTRPYVFRTEEEALAELEARRALESASNA